MTGEPDRRPAETGAFSPVLALLVWSAGASVMLVFLVIGRLALARLRRDSEDVAEGPLYP